MSSWSPTAESWQQEPALWGPKGNSMPVVDAPSSAPDAPPSPPERKRFRWFLLGLLVGLAICSAIAAFVAVKRYQPLGSGSFGLEFAEQVSDEGPRSVYRLPYRHGE